MLYGGFRILKTAERSLVAFSAAKRAKTKPKATPTAVLTTNPSLQDATSVNCQIIGLTRTPTKNPPGNASIRFSSAVLCSMDFLGPLLFTPYSPSQTTPKVHPIHPQSDWCGANPTSTVQRETSHALVRRWPVKRAGGALLSRCGWASESNRTLIGPYQKNQADNDKNQSYELCMNSRGRCAFYRNPFGYKNHCTN